MQRPGVDGSAPELTGGREVIGWHAALGGEPAVGTHGEQAATAPDIGAVVGDVEGQITHNLDVATAGVLQQPLPLPLQLPLQQGFPLEGLGVLTFERLECGAAATGQRCRPLPPGPLLILAAQHHVAAVVLQPERLKGAPVRQCPVLMIGPVGGATQQRLGQQVRTLIRQGDVEMLRITAAGQRLQIGGRDQAIEHQLLTVEQPGIEGEAAGGAVRRAGAIGGGQRQQLPAADALISQGIDPGMGHAAEAAAGRRARQGRGMEQNAGPPHRVGNR